MKKQLIYLALPLYLAACSSGNPLEVRRTSCPALAVPKHTGTLTRFAGPGRFDVQDVQITASINQLSDVCVEDANAVHTSVSFNILATRPAKGPSAAVELPYFVTIVKDGETLIAKQIYSTSLTFAQDAISTSQRQVISTTTPTVPLPPKPKKSNEIDEFSPPPKPAVYEILIGFQLSDAEAVYNITK